MSKMTRGQALCNETVGNSLAWHSLNDGEKLMWEERARKKKRTLTSRMQQAIVQLLKAGEPLSAYEIGGAGIGTMRALEERGLVKSRHTPGSIAFPHTSILWRLTEEGRKEAERIAAQ